MSIEKYSTRPREYSYKQILMFAILTLFPFCFNRAFAKEIPNNLKILPGDSIATVELFKAIRSGSVNQLADLVARGGDVNAVQDGYTVLMAAALNGSTDQMKWLIDHGAKVNFQNEDGISALWLAIPDWDKTNLLLDHGADAHSKSKEGYNALVKVVMFPGTSRLFKLLVAHGAEPKTGPDNMVLSNACMPCDTTLLKLVLSYGYNPNDSVMVGDWPVNIAIYYGCYESLKILVDKGANVNSRTFGSNLPLLNNITPLMNAVLSGDKKAFYYLLDHGADPSAKTANGLTVLMLLQQSEVDVPEMTQALLDHGADPNARANDGSDALYFALKKGNTTSAQLLKKYVKK